MKVRKAVALAVAVPALVVGLAQPSAAQSADVATFAGTFELKPTVLPQQQVMNLCFFAFACANTAEPNGTALGAGAGAGADVSVPAPHVVDGLQATASYVETCTPGTGFQPIGSAELSGIGVHDRVSGKWTATDLRATWTRAGLVAVISGQAVGAALFTPAGAPACGVASPVAVAGLVELTY